VAVRDSRPAGSSERASALAVWSWALYDFSNTIFSVSILSYFFPLWLREELGAGPGLFNFISAASALLVAFTAPFLGALADQRQRRRPYLVILTLLAVAATGTLDLTESVLAGVVFFVAADVSFQSAIVFYNALLPGVSVGRGAGKVSGYGTGAGYVGAIFSLVVLTFVVTDPQTVRSLLGPLGGWIQTGGGHNSNAFVPTAALYLIFSLPAFFFVPDRRVRAPRPLEIGAPFRDVVSTIRNIRGYGGLGAFILATLLYMDAANTTVTNMSFYGREVFEMDQTGIRNLLLFSTVFAALGSVGFGYASDRVGPRRTLLVVLLLWLVSIVLVAGALAPWMLLVAGPLVGAALGATWTVSRILLVALSPPEKLGEFFGLYSIAGRLSAITGPALIAVMLTLFDGLGPALSYRVAVGSLTLIMILGIFFLVRVPDVRPDATVDEFAHGTLAGTVDSSA
jgi:UMF1 family MFS transporter